MTENAENAAPRRRNRGIKADPATLWVNNLKQIRKARGPEMTQARLAELISSPDHEVGQTTISAIENGRISGRNYMFALATALEVDAVDIFPHAAFISVPEAASAAGVSTTLLYRRVQDGNFPVYKIHGNNFVRPEDIMGEPLKKRVGPSIRDRMKYFIERKGPLTIHEMLDQFGPFASEEDRERTKNSLMQLLSRYPEFVADKSSYPARWTYETDLVGSTHRRSRPAPASRTKAKVKSSAKSLGRRAWMHEILKAEGPMTSTDLVARMGPFTSEADRVKTKNAVVVALSHYPEFVSDKSTFPGTWGFDSSLLVTPVGRGRRARQVA